jgi:RNA polymerase sigma factor (sigma-70 family)
MTTVEDDQYLIDCIRAGDPRAWEKCVQRFSDMVWRILRGSLHLSTDDAADAFQEIFLKIQEKDFHRLRQWRGRAPLDAYMVVVVRRLARDYVRAQHQEKLVEGANPDPVDPAPTPEEVALLAERQRAVQTCRERQAERDRELLDLRYTLDLSYQAIAARMSMTVSNVGVALSRAEARIARCLRERYPSLFGDWEEGVPAAV